MENPGFHNSEKDITKNGISKIGDPSKEDQSCKLKVEEGITFSWSNLSVSTRPKKGGSCFGLIKSDDIPSKPILRNVSGIVRPGELLAIMGASGAGKSTLLNTLLFRNLGDLKVTGKRIANGSEVTPNNLTALSGYVQQDDLFFGTLTVQEHLTFQAMVRMDKEIPMWKRMERVEEVMKEVGLYKSKDTVIGIPGRIKGISGGEMKRLSFASEVLTNPPLLFCDEPTSGLDSFMAASVMEMMMDLAKQGRTVICTIHQPASQLFNKFDRLLLLAEGRTAYLGDAKGASKFFSLCKFPCPENYNPADHFVEVLAIAPGREDECKEKVASITEQFDQSREGELLREEILTEEKNISEEEQTTTMKRSPYKASWFTQFRALTWRNALAIFKEPVLIKARFGQAILISIILGIIFLGQTMDQAGIQNINGAFFILVTNMSFGSMFAVINVFCEELPIFLREHFNGMYRVDTYYLTRQLVDIPMSIIEPTIFLTILYFMVGMDRTPEKFFIALGIVLLLVQVIVSMGYLMSCLSPDVNIALLIVPVVLIPVMLFGGFYLNTGNVGWLVWLKYLSWFQYGFAALMINQWSDITNITCPAPAASDSFLQTTTLPSMFDIENYTLPLDITAQNLTGQSGPEFTLPCIRTGRQVLDQLNFDPDDLGFNIGLLVVLSVGARLLGFVAIYMRARKK